MIAKFHTFVSQYQSIIMIPYEILLLPVSNKVFSCRIKILFIGAEVFDSFSCPESKHELFDMIVFIC